MSSRQRSAVVSYPMMSTCLAVDDVDSDGVVLDGVVLDGEGMRAGGGAMVPTPVVSTCLAQMM